MYIGMNGESLKTKLDLLKDIININCTIDINDIPFRNYGITTNFSKELYSSTMTFIKNEISRILEVNGYSGVVSISNILFNESTGVFTAVLNISGQEFNVDITGSEE